MTEHSAEERLDAALDRLADGRRLARTESFRNLGRQPPMHRPGGTRVPFGRTERGLRSGAGQPDFSEHYLNGHTTPELRAAVYLRSLADSDPAAAPRAGFLETLRKELLMTDSLAFDQIAAPPASSRLRVPLPPHTIAIPRKQRFVAGFSFAAILALIVAGIYLTVTSGGEQGPDEQMLPAAAAATPSSMAALPGTPVDLSECATTARPDGTVAGLIGQTPTHSPLLPKMSGEEKPADQRADVDPGALLEQHPAASAEQLDGINTTVRELTACRFYFNPVSTWNVPATPVGAAPEETYIGLDGRLYALFSDDFFRKEATLWTGAGIQGPTLTTYWIPQGSLPWRVEDARQLPDGRVIATLAAPPESVYFTRVVAVFSEHDGRWLIDEYGAVAYSSAGRAYPQYLDIALQNDAGPSKAIPSPSVDGFLNTRPITVTVANLGDVDQRFVIDRLGIDLIVPAGHSVAFAITPPVGKYVVEAYVQNPATGQFDQRFPRLQYVLNIVGAGTPISMG